MGCCNPAAVARKSLLPEPNKPATTQKLFGVTRQLIPSTSIPPASGGAIAASIISMSGASGEMGSGFFTSHHEVNDNEQSIEQHARNHTVRHGAGGGRRDFFDVQRLREPLKTTDDRD